MKKSSREEVASYTTIVNAAINLHMSQSNMQTVADTSVFCCTLTSLQAPLCHDDVVMCIAICTSKQCD